MSTPSSDPDTTDRNEPESDLPRHHTVAVLEPLAVDAEQAAALIGVSRSMFFKLVDSGHIGPMGVRLGKCVRYPLAELRDWAAAGMPPRHEWVAHREK